MPHPDLNAPPTEPIRVLLVDDHQSILWGLVKLIEGEHPRMSIVGTASSAAEALAKAEEYQPNVVVLDIDLGMGKSGLDLLPELLKRCSAQVLVLTGLRDQVTRDQAVLRGARGVVQKEEPAEVILQAIERVHAGDVWLDKQTIGNVLSRLSKAGEQPVSPEARKIATLTRKEREVVAAVVREGGSTNKRIADHLHISDHTLRNHLSSIYAKLSVGNRLELYVFATQHNVG